MSNLVADTIKLTHMLLEERLTCAQFQRTPVLLYSHSYSRGHQVFHCIATATLFLDCGIKCLMEII